MPCDGLHTLLSRNLKDLATGSRLFFNYPVRIMILVNCPQASEHLKLYNPENRMLYLLYKRSEFLAGKKFLLFKTPFALAALTAKRHLAGT